MQETALHLACQYGSSEMVKLLLERKSDVTARQVDGRNPLDVAIDGNHETCVRILIEDEKWKESLQNVTITPESCTIVVKYLLFQAVSHYLLPICAYSKLACLILQH